MNLGGPEVIEAVRITLGGLLHSGRRGVVETKSGPRRGKSFGAEEAGGGEPRQERHGGAGRFPGGSFAGAAAASKEDRSAHRVADQRGVRDAGETSGLGWRLACCPLGHPRSA